jgi:hypothetical protein
MHAMPTAEHIRKQTPLQHALGATNDDVARSQSTLRAKDLRRLVQTNGWSALNMIIETEHFHKESQRAGVKAIAPNGAESLAAPYVAPSARKSEIQIVE